MDTALVGILVALIGLVAGLLGGYLTARQQARLEERKWRVARQDELEKEIRLAAAEVTRKVVSAVQAISWLAWKAKYQPDQIDNDDITAYDKKISELFSEIM